MTQPLKVEKDKDETIVYSDEDGGDDEEEAEKRINKDKAPIPTR